LSQFKPVILDPERCNGCVSCMKRCPTEAIRVRGGKAVIRYELCMGCGECVKACPTNAKKECYDSFDGIKDFAYTICLPSPALYGQFSNLVDINVILNALLALGFNKVFEVASGAEIVSAGTQVLLENKDFPRPIIGTGCPAATELILMRYGHLAPQLSPIEQPEVIAAKLAVDEAIKETGLPREKIGVFAVTQCAAKVSSLKSDSARKYIDRVLAVKEIYFNLLAEIPSTQEKPLADLARAGKIGIGWAAASGESSGLCIDNYVSADGAENVVEVLNQLENRRLHGIDFAELNMCSSGCVGGSMNVENPFLARARLRILRNKAVLSVPQISCGEEFCRTEYQPKDVCKLSQNRAEAIKLTKTIQDIHAGLPGLDCGACGAPRCMALAEDIAKGEEVACKLL